MSEIDLASLTVEELILEAGRVAAAGGGAGVAARDRSYRPGGPGGTGEEAGRRLAAPRSTPARGSYRASGSASPAMTCMVRACMVAVQ